MISQINSIGGRLCSEEQRRRILRIAEAQFAATGLTSTVMASIAKAARVPEELMRLHCGTKRKLFEEVVTRNSRTRLASLQKRLFSMADAPPLECIERMAESTVLSCVDPAGNASVMSWALMEIPDFAADIYRAEIGSTEALWDGEIRRRLGDSPVRGRLAVHLVPYAAHACMAFGLWLVTLRHNPTTAKAPACQYAGGIRNAALAVLTAPSGTFEAA